MADATRPTPDAEQAPLVALIHDRGGFITPRQLQHAARRYRGDVAKAKGPLDDLVTTGLGSWGPDGKTFTLDPNIASLMDLGRRDKIQIRRKREITDDAATVDGVTGAAGHGDRSQLQGLGTIPPGWPDLPPNASLQAELAWVQAHRLAMIEGRPSGGVHVHLDRASEPAPSKAALGWLETSIRSYAKYVDVVSRALKDEQDEQEGTRRERMRLDDIKALLDEMHEDERV